jgi:hypothetical protein
MGDGGLGSYGSGQNAVASCCQHGDEHEGPTQEAGNCLASWATVSFSGKFCSMELGP